VKKLLFVLGVSLAAISMADGEKVRPASEDQEGFKRILRLAEKSFPECVAEARDKGVIVGSEYVYTPKPEEGKFSRTYKYDIKKDGEVVGSLTIGGRPGMVMKNLQLKSCDVE
jgi:hypothetical protein